MRKLYLTIAALFILNICFSQANYCVPATSFGCTYGTKITRMELNTLLNVSGDSCDNVSPSAYTLYDTVNFAHTTHLQRGSDYEARITIGTGSNGGVAVWIDFNDNGVFENLEKYHDSTYTLGGAMATYDVAIPANAPLGIHRMRVRVAYGQNPAQVDPCNFYTFSETEDYFVRIVDAPACPGVNNIHLSALTSTNATISWACNNCNNSYIIEYGPQGFIPGTGSAAGQGTVITGTYPLTISGLSPSTSYDVYIRQDCGSSGISYNSPAFRFRTACTATTIPYTENFDATVSPALPNCTSREDVNNDNSTWTIATASGFSGQVLKYKYSTVNSANDWFYTPALNLSSGTSYTLSFKYGASSYIWSEKMEVKYGSAPASSAMTVPLLDFPTITGYTRQSGRITFSPATSGTYYIGFRAYSLSDQYLLYLDSIVVEQTPACLAVINPVADSISHNAARLKWSCTACSSMIVEYGPQGFVPGTGAIAGGGTIITTSQPEVLITGLETSSVYDAYVRQNCSSTGNGYSQNVSVSFKTKPCPLPYNVSISDITTTSASIGFNCNHCTGTFIVEYGPYPFRPGAGDTAGTGGTLVTSSVSPVNLTNLVPGKIYQVYMRQICAPGKFSSNSYQRKFTTLCTTAGVPYFEDFESSVIPNIPACTRSENVNNDYTTWTATRTYGSNGKALRYSWNYFNPANDWFFTQGVHLTAGINYNLAFKYWNNSSYYSEDLKVKYGNAASSSAMNNLLIDLPSITGGQQSTAVVTFTPPGSGVYYFGFHAYSEPNQFYLYLDSISVTVATSRPLQVKQQLTPLEESVVKLYPNPSTKQITIQVESKNTGRAALSISDGRGQVIHRKGIALMPGGNKVNVDLSNYSSGQYFISITGDVFYRGKFSKL
jgi:hypothetical protein